MKKKLITFSGCLILIIQFGMGKTQRVAPGVPPQQYNPDTQYQQHQQFQQMPQYQHQQQQYQQQQPQMQYQQQQPQMHQQQPPPQQQQQFQHQQQPVQHQQQPVQHQQQPHPQQGGHDHGHGHHDQKVLNAGNMQQERAHIAEHMEVPIDTSKMSEQELQFHYFKMHDSDNNNKLDGCELIKSLIHWHEQGSKQPHQEGQPQVEEKVFSDDELSALIDPILTMDDISRDGFIDYPEFIKAQQKAANAQKQQQEQQDPQTQPIKQGN